MSSSSIKIKRGLEGNGKLTTSKRPRRRLLSARKLEDNRNSTTEEHVKPFDGLLVRRSATEIYQLVEDAIPEGYLEFKVYMKWHIPQDKFRICCETRESGDAVRFEIWFKGRCYDHLVAVGLAFDIGDHVCISLKAASLQQLKATSPKMLSNYLLYEEGVALQFISKKTLPSTGMLIDTWAEQVANRERKIFAIPEKVNSADDWFSTPPFPRTDPAVHNMMEVDPQTTTHAKQSTVESPTRHPRIEAIVDLAPSRHEVSGIPIGAPVGISHDTILAHKTALNDASVVPGVSEVTLHELSDDKCSDDAGQGESTENPIPQDTTCSLAQPAQPAQPPTKRLYRDTNGGKRGRPAPAAQAVAPGKNDQQAGQDGNKGRKKAEKKAKREAKRAGAPTTEASTAPEGGAQGPFENASPADTLKTVPQETVKQSSNLKVVNSVQTSGETGTKAAGLVTKPVFSPPGSIPSSSSLELAAPAVSQAHIVPASEQESSSKPADRGDPIFDLQAGCQPSDSLFQYPPLKDLQRGSGRKNFIGVVMSVGQSKTSIGQFIQRLLLTDPSFYSRDDPRAGFGVNCFAKEDSGLVTDVRKGDVVILRTIQVTAHGAKMLGVGGSSMPWTWGLFRPATGDTTTAHRAFKLSPEELNYCIRLGDWWRSIEEQQHGGRDRSAPTENNVTVHDLAAVVGSGARDQWRRVHRLIKDASPDAPPNGFFDCTVEVLKTHENFNGVWSVYVTDYTQNELLPDVDASWSDPLLANSIFKVEMWEQAAEAAAKMEVGEYYALKNVRMRNSSGGYTEGTISQGGAKIRKVDADELEGEDNLVQLLKRKSEWEKNLAESGGREQFAHKLFKDAELDEHLDCTVFVLHVSVKEKEERAFIYVTDYTQRNDLSEIPATANWTRDVPDNRIVKILLTDRALEMAKRLYAKDYVALRKIRLKSAGSGRHVSGRLGGDEQLVFKLDPTESGNRNLALLIKRQKAWEREVNSRTYKAAAAKHGGARPIILASSIPSRKYEQLGAFTLKELKEHAATPAVFRPVVARIVDFFPEHLQDCVILRCTQCNMIPPSNFTICTRCDDSMDDTHVRSFYRFSFQLEDEEGERLNVSAGNPESSYLKDLPPEDLRDNSEGLEAFTDKLRPFLGDLVSKHSDLIDEAEDGLLPSDGERPLFKMVIAKMSAGDEGTDYCILDIDPKPLGQAI